MLNKEIVFRDAYRLLCLFMADKAIFDMTPEDQQVWGGSQRSEEPLFRLRHLYNDDEVNHTLINLAICNRTHMDQMREQFGTGFPSAVCGKLTKDMDDEEQVESLSFREACNKIIHAEKFAATFLKDGTVAIFSGEMEPMHHEMWLYGKHNSGKNWKADLDVLSFLRATSDNFILF